MFHATWKVLDAIPGCPIWTPRYVFQREINGVHSHEFLEIAIIFDGSSQHVLNNVTSIVTTGDVFIFAGDHTHAFINCHDLDLGYVMVEPQYTYILKDQLQKVPGYRELFIPKRNGTTKANPCCHLHVNQNVLSRLASLHTQMRTECIERAPGFEAVLLSLYVQMVAELARCHDALSMPTPRALLKVTDIIWHIENHYAENLTLADLADIANVSKAHCIRIFKEAKGCSPIHYLNKFRIEKAAALLLETTMTISEIAGQVGYTDSNYFSRQFKQLMGISPHLYIKQRSRNADSSLP